MNESQFSTVMQAIGHLSQEISLIRKELKNCVTKEDAKKFATKEDLKEFARKDDLRNFATKDDLKGFATKSFVKKEISAMTTVILEALGFSLADTEDTLGNHEVRLVRLEPKRQPTGQIALPPPAS